MSAPGAAADDNLVLRRTEPPNAETRLDLQEGLITPNERFYVRCNFPLPDRCPDLSLAGLFANPVNPIRLDRFRQRQLLATLECAGNGRSFLQPPTPGEQWALGAVGTAEWMGVALADVIEDAALDPAAREIVFEGADGFSRSLPAERALHPDTLLVTTMNGAPLPPAHGGPLRLLVPGWYGMASVKWLHRMTAVREPFEGHFQVEKYVIDGRPVREMEVRSVIAAAAPGDVHGFAWSGHGSIARVELSRDGGGSWVEADLGESAPPYGWTTWSHRWSPAAPGTHRLVSRATDSTGRVQPASQSWNELGYANNQSIPVDVVVGPPQKG